MTTPSADSAAPRDPEFSLSELNSQYAKWTSRHADAQESFVAALREMLRDSGASYDQVSARVKSWRSYRAKALLRTPTGEFRYTEPFTQIWDLVACRITTLTTTEIPVITQLLGQSFDVVKLVDKTAETRTTGSFGYGSVHMILTVPTPALYGLEAFCGLTFEVQVRTVLQHAWAEFEHDIRYKAQQADSDPRIDRAFTLAAGLIELADQQFAQIAATTGSLGTTSVPSPATGDVELTAAILPGMLALLLGPEHRTSKTSHYTWLLEMLHAHGVTHSRQLAELLAAHPAAELSAAMGYHFPPGHARVIDDVLLAAFGQAHIDKTSDSGDDPQRRRSLLTKRYAQLI